MIATSLIQGKSQTKLTTRKIPAIATGDTARNLRRTGINYKPVTTGNMLTNQMFGTFGSHGKSPSIV
jgi:hypothetical protein